MNLLDAARLSAPATLQTEICVVGAGPAGLSVAHALAAAGRDVVLLESGGLHPSAWCQELSEGPAEGDPYAGLRVTRHRQAGGTAHLWNTPVGSELGAKYLPLHPGDLAARPGTPDGAWPFDHATLLPWYQRAQGFCGLGPFEYDGAWWSDRERPCFEFADGALVSRVYQFGAARPFTEAYLERLQAGRKARLCTHATVCGLVLDRSRERVIEAVARAPDGPELRVRAASFVLAGGAVENARLLLLAELGNAGGWVGRCFMEHPRDSSLILHPAHSGFPARAGFYDAHTARDGTVICGRLELPADVLRREELPGFSITLLPHRVEPPRPLHQRVLGRLSAQRDAEGGYGWSRKPARAAGLLFRLLLNLEQRPHPDNRVTLVAERDLLGVPRPGLTWRWRPEEQRQLERIRTLVAGAFEHAGLGRIERIDGGAPDPNAHHHAGTTRMHPDPEGGVVDGDARVHGTANLYLAGASVFPSAGFANPTLTIVALALRLADHLG